MNELARARSVYPVVALTPQGGALPIGAKAQRKGAGGGRAKDYGKSEGKGRGSSKGSPGRRPLRQRATRTPASQASFAGAAIWSEDDDFWCNRSALTEVQANAGRRCVEGGSRGR